MKRLQILFYAIMLFSAPMMRAMAEEQAYVRQIVGALCSAMRTATAITSTAVTSSSTPTRAMIAEQRYARRIWAHAKRIWASDPVMQATTSTATTSSSSTSSTERQRLECEVCLEEQNRSDFIRLSCQHNYCQTCLQHLVDQAIRDKTSTQLKCPDRRCAQVLTQEDIRTITNNNREKIDAIAEITAHEWLAQNADSKQCPTPNCSYVFLNAPGNRQAITCPQCDRTYCSQCLHNHTQNIDITCEAANRSNTENQQSEQWIRSNTRQCPRCNKSIQKNGGCRFIKCTCHHGFCWDCLGPYDHVAHNCNPIQQPAAPAPAPHNAVPISTPQQRAYAQQGNPALQRALTQQRTHAQQRAREQARQEELRRQREVAEQARRNNTAQIPAYNQPMATITAWSPGVLASRNLLASSSALRAEQERMPTWVRISFNQEVTDDFVNNYFRILNTYMPTISARPNKFPRERATYMATVSRSTPREQLEAALNRANAYFA